MHEVGSKLTYLAQFLSFVNLFFNVNFNISPKFLRIFFVQLLKHSSTFSSIQELTPNDTGVMITLEVSLQDKAQYRGSKECVELAQNISFRKNFFSCILNVWTSIVMLQDCLQHTRNDFGGFLESLCIENLTLPLVQSI